MMRFYSMMSTILHPIVVPTLGVFLYLFLVPNDLVSYQKYVLLGIVFIITYIIPVISLLLLRGMGLIKDFQVFSIRERRIPVIIMTILFYFLGNAVIRLAAVRDLGILFYGTSLSLLVIYALFLFKIKSSLHLVSLGSAIGFFIWLSSEYSMSFLPVIMILILLSGLLGSSRLHLEAHKPLEVYTGFFIGVICQIAVYWVL